jgi:hypothetical protein
MEARIDANNDKFDVLRSNLVSRMDIHQARTEADQGEIIAKIEAHQEGVNAWKSKTNTRPEETEAHPERTESRMDTGQEPLEAEIKNCLVDVEATYLETSPKEPPLDRLPIFT